MKRRYSSIVLAAILGSMLLGGCGTGTTKTTETSYAGETISGQVSEVGENTIKMEVDNSEEETTITVDDDTFTGKINSSRIFHSPDTRKYRQNPIRRRPDFLLILLQAVNIRIVNPARLVDTFCNLIEIVARPPK